MATSIRDRILQIKNNDDSKGLFKSYHPQTLYSSIYTSLLPMQVSSKGEFLAVCGPEGTRLHFLEVESGGLLDWIDFEARGKILDFHMLANDQQVAISLALESDGLQQGHEVAVWSLKTKKKIRVWSREDPCTCLRFHPSGSLLAMGFGTGKIRVFQDNSIESYETHEFVGHNGKINLLRFHPTELLLYSSGFDGLRVWDLLKRTNRRVVNSTVLDLSFTKDGTKFVVTTGQNLIYVYDNSTFEQLKQIPVYEPIYELSVVPASDFGVKNTNEVLVTASTNGSLRIWNLEKEKMIKEAPKDSIQAIYTRLFYSKELKNVIVGTEDSNLIFYDPLTLKRSRQILGMQESLIEIAMYGDHNIAVGTTGNEILLINLTNRDTHFLSGHTDSVVSLRATDDNEILISGSRDKTVRVWDLKLGRCVAFSDSHADGVGAVEIAPNQTFFISVSEDTILKKYKIKPVRQYMKKRRKAEGDFEEKDILPLPNTGRVAHEKGINDCTISPNSLLIATASFDKSVKVWDSKDLNLINTFQHKKGVWSVEFSPIEKVIVTGCSDNLIRLWAIDSGACLKVFEGHNFPVLTTRFINKGTQLVSGSASGVMKLWNIKTASCVNTFDHHTDRLWAISTASDGKTLITGGEDCRLVLWTENTKEASREEKDQLDEFLVKEQKLSNYIYQKNFKEAFLLTLELDQPRKLYNLLEELRNHDSVKLENLIASIPDHEMVMKLFEFCIDWNTNSKFCSIANWVLKSLFLQLDPKFVSWAYEKSVDSLSAYNRKHFKRLENLQEQSFLLDYCEQQMRILLPLEESQKYQDSETILVENRKKRKLYDPVLIEKRRKLDIPLGDIHEELEAIAEESDSDEEAYMTRPAKQKGKVTQESRKKEKQAKPIKKPVTPPAKKQKEQPTKDNVIQSSTPKKNKKKEKSHPKKQKGNQSNGKPKKKRTPKKILVI